nr:MAG: hypothetical protein [Bacteriophage sp.]
MTFADTYKSKSQVGKSSLRRAQWKLAEKNASMAIWLGKQYLDQSDGASEKSGDPAALAALVLAVKGGNNAN